MEKTWKRTWKMKWKLWLYRGYIGDIESKTISAGLDAPDCFWVWGLGAVGPAKFTGEGWTLRSWEHHKQTQAE